MEITRLQQIAVLAILLIAIFIAGAVYTYTSSRQDLAVEIRAPVSATLFETGSDEPIETFNISQKLRLQKGEYVITSQTTDTYDESSETFDLGDEPVLVVIDPPYTEKKTEEFAEVERDDILTAIDAYNPKVRELYTITNEAFYDDAEWYSAQLNPKTERAELPNNTDNLRIVLHNAPEGWVVIAEPTIIVSSKRYPDIPDDVLQSVNRPYSL